MRRSLWTDGDGADSGETRKPYLSSPPPLFRPIESAPTEKRTVGPAACPSGGREISLKLPGTFDRRSRRPTA